MTEGLIAERAQVRSLHGVFRKERKAVYDSEGLRVSSELLYRDRKPSDNAPLQEVYERVLVAADARDGWLQARKEYRMKYPLTQRLVGAVVNPFA